MAEVICLKETVVVRTANVTRLENIYTGIQLFKWLLLSVHSKLISSLIGQPTI